MNPLSQSTGAVSSARTYILRVACYFFLSFGILALGYAGFVFADSHAYQALEMNKFKQAGRLSEPRILLEGDVIGEIQVPRLGLDAVVVQGDSPATLRRAVGHISESALPGEWGNVALAGHRDTFFRPLQDIQLGDEIRFKTRERSFDYRVESIEVVAPTDIRVLASSTGHDLTLLTCFPIYFVGPAPKRLVVRAREVDRMLQEQVRRENDVKAPGGQLSVHQKLEEGTIQ
jgi:LPXTG-site transpeptidase (sortase) family protein